MADNAPITPAAPAATFDPAQWLSRFESVGGNYLATESQTSFCLACEDMAQGQSPAHAMLRELTDQQRTDVVAHIRAQAGLSPTSEEKTQQPDLNAIPLEKLSEPAGSAPLSSGATLDHLSEGPHEMDMTHAFAPALTTQRPKDWDSALAEYEAVRAWSDSLPLDHPHNDIAIDAYCAAMDHLVEEVRSPNYPALIHKIELARERWEDFPLPDEWLDAFQADLKAWDRSGIAPSSAITSRLEFQAVAQIWTKTREAVEAHRGDSDIPDDLSNAETKAWKTMLNTPAPDLAALRFKLEQLLHIEPAVDAIEGWSGDEVRQTLADIVRLMNQSSAQANVFLAGNGDANFWALVRQWEAVEAIPSEHSTDADVDQAGALMSAIMACKAPDPAATKWKLDYVLAESCFSADYIVPIRAEYDHWLNVAAQSGNAGCADLTAQPDDWDTAFAAAKRAEADMRVAYEAQNVAEKAYMAALPAAERSADAAGNVFYAALEDLFAVPAPNLSNVLEKMELAHQHGEELNAFTHVMGDLRRLIGGIAAISDHRMAA